MTARPNFIDWTAIYPDVDQSRIYKMDKQAEMWLDNATTAFQFDKEDPVVGLVETVKQVGWHVLGKGGSDCGDEKLGKTFEQMMASFTQNSDETKIKMCRMGVMTAVLAIIVKHPFDTIRHQACELFKKLCNTA